jgi:maleate cis-trans isomerase
MLQPTMVTDNNPFEFYLMAPPGVQLVLTSLGLPEGVRGDDAYARAIAGIEEPIRRLLGRGVDVIIQAGVPPIVEKGWGFEDELRARVAQWTELPFASDVGCCIAAMHALGMQRIGLLVSGANQQSFAEYIGHAGIDVATAQGISTPPREETGAQPLSVPYRAAVALRRAAPDIDGVWIPIASRPTVGMIEEIERAIGVPVVTSAQAMMWQGLRLAEVPMHEVVGFGRLFQTEPTRAAMTGARVNS